MLRLSHIILLQFLVVSLSGCHPSEGFQNGSGDLNHFLWQQVSNYGGKLKARKDLPEWITSWRYKTDAFHVLITLQDLSFEQWRGSLQSVLGPADDVAYSPDDDRYDKVGYYNPFEEPGLTITFYEKGNEVGIDILRRPGPWYSFGSTKNLDLRAPRLTPGEVLSRFRSRASDQEVQFVDNAIAAGNTEFLGGAYEPILFQLTNEELMELGITQVGETGHYCWSVAFAADDMEIERALKSILSEIPSFGSGGHGRMAWYVPREQYFLAREALVSSDKIIGMDLMVTTPKFRLTDPSLTKRLNE